MRNYGVYGLLLVLYAGLLGCQNQSEPGAAWNVWQRTDVVSVSLEKRSGGHPVIMEAPSIDRWMALLRTAVYEAGQPDLRPPEYVATVRVAGGSYYTLSFWLEQGAGLFTLSGQEGHYKLPPDTQEKLSELMNKVVREEQTLSFSAWV
ncbi:MULTISPECIES: hypothetical protein [Paenibacillus]|uniref:hypothetical protein n=1 Tax=Paenibacillus TaxID=44249 RepID=UPI0022B92A23|nr:hypothetical protein [Paenibacillus caseinilyticus]MCZ8521977.1 hypothetical protein [Paenibacillus caseinilyticus]